MLARPLDHWKSPCTVHARRFVPTLKPHTQALLAKSTLNDIVGDLGGQTSASISLTEPSSGRGRSLVAKQEVQAGEVLISLPLEATLHVSEGPDTLPWSVAMALAILEKQSSAGYKDWMDSLPGTLELSLPITTFMDKEVAACGDGAVIREAEGIRQMLADAAEVLEEDLADLDASKEDLTWGVGLAHSRSFVLLGGDMGISQVITPGIDMCNHSFAPSAFVRFRHSPDACQGADAIAEICEPPSNSGNDVAELVAGDLGIREGEEVTISYGGRPDEFFYLFYGFLPDHYNPYNSVTIFADEASWTHSLCQKGFRPSEVAPLGVPGPVRVAAAEAGFDEEAEDIVLAALRASFSCAPRLSQSLGITETEQTFGTSRLEVVMWEILLQRCQDLENLDDPLGEACRESGSEEASGNLQLSERFCARRQKLLCSLHDYCAEWIERYWSFK